MEYFVISSLELTILMFAFVCMTLIAIYFSEISLKQKRFMEHKKLLQEYEDHQRFIRNLRR